MTGILCLNCKLPLKFLFSAKDKKSNKKYRYYHCDRCQLIQISPFPNIKNLYHEDPYSRYISQNPQARFANRLPFGNALINRYLELTKNRVKEVYKLRKTGRLLDVGCAKGSFLRTFGGKWKLYGLEINTKTAQIAKKNVPNATIYTKKIESAKLPKGYFDVITLWHVFEHLKNPHLILKKIHSSLKVGGHIIIEIPNSESLYRKIFGKHWQLLMVPEHLYFYSKKTLSEVLVKNGFKVTKVKHFAIFTPSAISSLANFLRSYGINSELAILCGIFLSPLILLVNILSFSKRENLMIIAKK